jgi:hypothetical protein
MFNAGGGSGGGGGPTRGVYFGGGLGGGSRSTPLRSTIEDLDTPGGNTSHYQVNTPFKTKL